jgi:hypothetical protein
MEDYPMLVRIRLFATVTVLALLFTYYSPTVFAGDI